MKDKDSKKQIEYSDVLLHQTESMKTKLGRDEEESRFVRQSGEFDSEMDDKGAWDINEKTDKLDTFQLLDYEDCPPFLQDNQFIRKGYRANFSIRLCFESILHLHNESWNIWTHVGATVGFFVLMVLTLTVLLDKPDSMDLLIFSVFLACAQLNMGFSAVFHIFGCHSAYAYKKLAILDYTGISVMIVGSYYPPLYYGFECNPFWRNFYLGVITLLGVCGIAVSTIPVFSTARFRVVRALFFIAFGFFAIFPVPHLLIINGWYRLWPVFVGLTLMGVLYVTGAAFYSSRIPERFFPGKFDVGVCNLASSHVIWHWLTIAAALIQFITCVECYRIHRMAPCI